MTENTHQNALVFERDGKALTNSRDVASCFGKRHDHVLRDIDNLLKSLHSPDLGNGLFVEVEQPDGQGINHQTFDMTRDGFALLAMGFTGAKALQFKLRYIDQFNRMEATLRSATGITMLEVAIKRAMKQQKQEARGEFLDVIRQAFPAMKPTPSVPPVGYLRFPDYLAAKGIACLTGKQKSGMSRRVRTFCNRAGFKVEKGYGGAYRGGNAYPIYAMDRWWAEGGAALVMSLVKARQAGGLSAMPLLSFPGGSSRPAG
jgi:Rha family phage regulatory protein